MTAVWTEDLLLAREGDRAAEDRLIVHFMHALDVFAKRFGGFRDPDELRSVLHLELVTVIRTRLKTMRDDQLARLVGARLYYCCLRHLRAEKERMERMPNSTYEGVTYDDGQERIDADDLADAVCEGSQEREIIDLLVQGFTSDEIADKVKISRQTVFNTKRRVRLRLREHMEV